jgi:hypothetical protein
LRGEARLEDDLIKAGISSALPFDFQQAQGFVLVLGFQGLLLAGARVLQIINIAAAIDVESLLHRRMLEAGGVTPLGCSRHGLPNGAEVVADFESRNNLLAILLANGTF